MRRYAVLVERDSMLREVTVMAASREAADLMAEAVVDADGAEQWPIVSEWKEPYPEHWLGETSDS